MFEQFEAYITRNGQFSQDDLKLIRSMMVQKKIRRKQFLLQEGEVCRHKIFVCKGLLRNYRLKDDGTEYVMRFSPENTWTVDAESFNNQVPSHYYIDALEDSELLLWTHEQVEALYKAIPAFKAFSVYLLNNSIHASQDRIMKNISYSSEEKYQDFITSFPDVFSRVPLHMVASYLGVSRETLSRIRHAQVKQGRDIRH
jgi:CRP-like cAMP-binding protein